MVKSQRPPRPYNDSPAGPAPLLPPNASAGKRWRFRRNMVIFVAHRNGLSQRLLADVFDLPRSSVAEIIKTFHEYEIQRLPTHPDRSDGPSFRRSASDPSTRSVGDGIPTGTVGTRLNINIQTE